MERLSGTPAEAGVRGLRSGITGVDKERRHVSVEPLPKQGCERRAEAVAIISVEPLPKQGCETVSVSVEPLPKQGCEALATWALHRVSVEPLPKQGCEETVKGKQHHVSVEPLPKQGCEATGHGYQIMTSLSGTPAEAGVRVRGEELRIDGESSQWNPCRSRGASIPLPWLHQGSVKSQWNPCRSRGARSRLETSRLSGTPAEAGVRAGNAQ